MAAIESPYKPVGEKGTISYSGKQEDLLGRGGYGSVHPGSFDGREVAVKRILLIDWVEEESEIVLPIGLKHKNVVKILAVDKDDIFRYIILELCAGTLEHFIEGKYTGPIPTDVDVLYQIASGVQYLHKKELIHSDIKPGNILISLTKSVVMKVSDYGLSKPTNSRGTFIFQGISGTENWLAPEILLLLRLNPTELVKQHGTVQSDIFAVGCVFFYFSTRGIHPFGDDKNSIAENIRNGNPVNLTKLPKAQFAYDLIENMIKNKEERIDLEKVIPKLFYSIVGKKGVRYARKVVLGKGGFAIVHHGFYKDTEVAVKRIQLDWTKEEEREVKLQSSLKHEHILQILQDDKDDDFRYIVLELCAGTLEHFIEGKYTGPMPSNTEVLYQIASGVHYIHSKQLIHRDIKPENILISLTSPVVMKVSDFGLSKSTSSRGTCSLSGKRGTLNWMAPEMLNLNPKELVNERGTVQSDIFAVGCVFFYFIKRGVHPFGNRGDECSMEKNIRDDKPVNLKQLPKKHFAYGLIENMIKKKVEERIGLKQVIEKFSYAIGVKGTINYSGKSVLGKGLSESMDLGIFKGSKVTVKRIQLIDSAGDREIKLKINLNHQNVLNIFEFDKDHDFRYIVLELSAGTLEHFIKGKYTGPMPSDEQVLYQIACGVQYLHSQKLIHRDIKPENILISCTSPVVMKVCDYGLNIATNSLGTCSVSGTRGTHHWMAPEILQFNKHQLLYLNEGALVKERGIHPFGEGVRKMTNIIEDKPVKMKELEKEHFAYYGLIENMIKNKKEERISLTEVIETLENPSIQNTSSLLKSADETIPSSEELATDSLTVRILRYSGAPSDAARIAPTEVIKQLEEPIRENTNLKAAANESIPLSAELATGSPTVRVPRDSALFGARRLGGHIKWVFLVILVTLSVPKPSPLSHSRIEQNSESQGNSQPIDITQLKWNAIDRSVPKISGYIRSRFHPTESVLACGSTGSSSVLILKGANGSVPFSNWEIERQFIGQTDERFYALEWNVNGTQLAAGCEDGTVIVWSYPSGRKIFEEKKHSHWVVLIVWNPFRQDVFATRGWDGKELLFWNSRRENGDAEKAHHFLTRLDKEIWRVAWISANQIAIGLENGEIEVWEIDEDKGSSQVIKRFIHGEEDEPISVLQWNERTKYLASSSYRDKWIKIWSMDSDRPVHTLEVHSRCCSFAWRRNVKTDNDRRKDKEKFIIAGGLQDGSVVIWNPLEEDETKRKRILPQKHSDCVVSLSFSPDGQFLASADFKDELIIWSTQTWLPVFTCQNDGLRLSWMSTDSSSVPINKLAVPSRNKVCVIEQIVTD